MASDYDDMTTGDQPPGSQLKALRESAGFSLSYVAEQMRLSEAYISYLEHDEFKKLPTEPFVLGYYRAYARILNISPDSVINSYRAYSQSHTDNTEPAKPDRDYSSSAYKPLKQRGEKQADKVKKSDNRLYAIIAFLLVVTWVVVSLLSSDTDESGEVNQSNRADQPVTSVAKPIEPSGTDAYSASESGESPSESSVGTVASAVVDRSVEQTAAEGRGTLADESVPGATDESVPGATSDSSSASVSASPDAPVSLASDAGSVQADSSGSASNMASDNLDELTFLFSGECWLEVTDAHGDVVAANLYQAGATAKLEGIAPFEVLLGNVRAVELKLNGEPVTMVPDGNRKTLRMTVGGQGPSAE